MIRNLFYCQFIFILVQCTTNPCELGGDFVPPNYQCLQATDNFNNVICTCPDGQSVTNGRCRKKDFLLFCFFLKDYFISIIGMCDGINCGIGGVCIEKSFFENLFYTCGCTNGTYNYLNPGPCTSKKNKKIFLEIIIINEYLNTYRC